MLRDHKSNKKNEPYKKGIAFYFYDKRNLFLRKKHKSKLLTSIYDYYRKAH